MRDRLVFVGVLMLTALAAAATGYFVGGLNAKAAPLRARQMQMVMRAPAALKRRLHLSGNVVIDRRRGAAAEAPLPISSDETVIVTPQN